MKRLSNSKAQETPKPAKQPQSRNDAKVPEARCKLILAVLLKLRYVVSVVKRVVTVDIVGVSTVALQITQFTIDSETLSSTAIR